MEEHDHWFGSGMGTCRDYIELEFDGIDPMIHDVLEELRSEANSNGPLRCRIDALSEGC